jgi:hypothetical protein
MGKDREVAWLNQEIAPFATYRLPVADLLPRARWPQQIEIQTGKYVVRPRYEGVCQATKNQRIAHVNVQRNDLKPTLSVASLKPLFGKGYILPAPILPQAAFRSLALATPMSTTQAQLPLKIFVYDTTGKPKAETSFGAHIFNTALVYKNEPQSYAGPPPGLRTRLFLALSDGPQDSVCFLIYPASTPWRPYSETSFILHDHQGNELAQHSVKIPCSGSHLFSYHQAFAEEIRAQAKGGYIIIWDVTCRLFGYHGTWGPEAFSFDHMFGF